jgi:hypothetical protein
MTLLRGRACVNEPGQLALVRGRADHELDPYTQLPGCPGEGMDEMTGTSTVDRSQWTSALDQLTREHEGEEVTIEIIDPTYGDNPEVEHLPFAYANYDYKDDVVFVAVGGASPRYPTVLRHMVSHPTEVTTTTEPPAVRVTDGEGTTTVVSFFPPGPS